MSYPRTVLLSMLAAVAMMFAGCASFSAGSVVNADGTPTAQTVTNIQTLCALDAAARPAIDTLMLFATPDEKLAVPAARAIIDPICANPSANIQAAALANFSAAVGQVVNIAAQLQARKSLPTAATAPAPAASGV